MPLSPTRRSRLVAACASLAVAVGALALPSPAQSADVTDGLVLSYDLTSGTGTTVTDLSGKSRNGTIMGGATYAGGSLVLDGVDDYVKLPDNLMTGLDSITISADVLVSSNVNSDYFFWGLGNTAGSAANQGGGYLMTSDARSRFRTAITPTNYSQEQNTQVTPTRPLDHGVFKTVTYTQTGTTGVLYENGTEVARNTGVTLLPRQVGGGTTTNNLLGKSNYAADRPLAGKLSSFRIYDRALSATEVRSLAASDADLLAADKAALDLGDLSAVTSNLTLPTTGSRGSAISWASSAPGTVSTTGAVTRPAVGQPDAQVTLTATLTRGSARDTKTFTATVKALPSDQSRVDAAAAALTLVEPDDVRGNLTLPTTAGDGTTVTWASSAPAVVSTSGVVSRPANGSSNATVTMTATVTRGSASATKQVVLTVKPLPAAAPYEGYAFSYFTGNSTEGENIYFAASRGNNALQWDEVNGGNPVLRSTLGQKGLRDPFIIRSPEGDTFYMIATDLSAARDGFEQRNGSRYLEVWESHDLVTWSQQRHVLVSPPTAGNTWAPEAYWDESKQSYVVYWASSLFAESDTSHSGGFYQHMLIAETRDFRTFTQPTQWQDTGSSRIDSTVLKEGASYYRFTKDEGGTTGCRDIIQEKSASLTALTTKGADNGWTVSDSCIGQKANLGAVEGPTVFKRNPGDTSPYQYYLFVDEYGGRGYLPLGTNTLDPTAGQTNWKIPTSYRLPASPRHGTVIPVTKTELAALRSTIPTAPPVKANAQGVVASYPLTADAKDTSGNGYDGTIAGNPTFTGGSLNLDGTDDHVKLPDNIMSGLDAITVTSQVWVDASQAGAYFLWGLGNTGGNGEGNGYLFSTGNAYRAAIAPGNYTTEQGLSSGANLPRGEWKIVTYTQDAAGNVVLYLDGRQVATRTGVTTKPGDIGNGVTTANYIGRSLYTGDRRLTGKVRDFRIYNRALSATEVADQGAAPTSIVSVALSSLKVPATIDDASSTITLPVKPGTDLTTLAPTYGVRSGTTVAPSGAADYTSPRQVTVTAPGGATRVYTVKAVVMGSPVLPGYNADPNIAQFGDTFYMYVTSDGFSNFGGNTFYVWKSKDLLNWTKSAQPFLTLDGDNGNVPWATGNAWAPTIIEKGGKYYFYFSGENKSSTLAKTIGVAVADSPEGPFTAQPEAMILNTEAVKTGQAIDPAAFKDPQTGRYYLFWGNGSPVYGELSDDMLSIKSGTTKAISGLTDFREGTFLNYRQGLYHLTYSIDDTGSPNYRVGYATSTSVDGPWKYQGVILEKDASQGILGTGHSSILNVAGTDEWYIAYHRFGIPGGGGFQRETTIDKLTFGADGLMQKVTPTLTSVAPYVAVTAPGAPSIPVVSNVTTTGADLSWTAPTDTGGAAITGYRVRLTQGGTEVLTKDVTGTTTTLTGLTAGQIYAVTVSALNSAGFGAASLAAALRTTAETTEPPVVTPPVVTPPVVTPPVVVPPVLATLMPPVPDLGAKLKGKGYEVGQKVKLVLTMAYDGTVTVKVDGKKKNVRVVDGRAVIKVRFLKPGMRKVVVTTAGDRVVKKVRVRR